MVVFFFCTHQRRPIHSIVVLDKGVNAKGILITGLSSDIGRFRSSEPAAMPLYRLASVHAEAAHLEMLRQQRRRHPPVSVALVR